MPLGIKGFQKGRRKTGGRRKGIRNRPKVRKTIVLEAKPAPKTESRQVLSNVDIPPRPTSTTSTMTSAPPSPATSPGHELAAAPRSSHHHGTYETPQQTWERERRRAAHAGNLSAGQVANMLEGLTPDGFDRNGRKVSFVESDKPFSGRSGRGLSGY